MFARWGTCHGGVWYYLWAGVSEEPGEIDEGDTV